MHELSLLNDLFKKIETVVMDNNAERATHVTVQLGALAHISPNHLREHFDQAKPGTSAENADLEVHLTEQNHPQAQDIMLESIEVE
ncbi:hypothetical protein VDG1235_2317 [Verrucomicrobiia bacterium DG1235]|nr:hypothetical protein VDG1235_2317 [Verrucomicrobiae bacterium DG1235]